MAQQIAQLHQLTPEQVINSPIPVVDRCGRMWGGPDRRGANAPDPTHLLKAWQRETQMAHTQIGSIIIHDTDGPVQPLQPYPGIIITTSTSEAIAAQALGLRALLYAGSRYQQAIQEVSQCQ